MQYSAQTTYRDPIGQCLTTCNADKLQCKSPRKDNRDIVSASFLPRINKPYRPDDRSSLNAPLCSTIVDFIGTLKMACHAR